MNGVGHEVRNHAGFGHGNSLLHDAINEKIKKPKAIDFISSFYLFLPLLSGLGIESSYPWLLHQMHLRIHP